MIEKKDWEAAQKQFDALQVNAIINSEIYDVALEHIKKKLAEFPEEDPMPDAVKEVVKSGDKSNG